MTASKIMQHVRNSVFSDINNEMDRQIEKFGIQNHPPEWYLTILMEEVGEAAKAALESKFNFDGNGKSAEDNYLEELVQIAAVAASAILCREAQLERQELNQPEKLTNTEILMYVLGWQGGTIHQLAHEIGINQDEILNADAEKMRELVRVAQTVRNARGKC